MFRGQVTLRTALLTNLLLRSFAASMIIPPFIFVLKGPFSESHSLGQKKFHAERLFVQERSVISAYNNTLYFVKYIFRYFPK